MTDSTQKKSFWPRLALIGGIVLALVLVFQFTSLKISDFSPTNIKNFILGFGVMAPVVFIVLYGLRGAVLVIPVGIMSLAGGLAFGKWWGTVYILIGATIGSSLSFFLSRYVGRDFIEQKLLKGRVKKFDEGIEKNGFKVILFMRLVPLFQYDAVNFGAGLSKVRFRDYLLATFIGMAPGGFINAMLGDSIQNPLSWQFFVAIGAFVLLMAVPTLYKYLKKKKTNSGISEEVSEALKP